MSMYIACEKGNGRFLMETAITMKTKPKILADVSSTKSEDTKLYFVNGVGT